MFGAPPFALPGLSAGSFATESSAKAQRQQQAPPKWRPSADHFTSEPPRTGDSMSVESVFANPQRLSRSCQHHGAYCPDHESDRAVTGKMPRGQKFLLGGAGRLSGESPCPYTRTDLKGIFFQRIQTFLSQDDLAAQVWVMWDGR